MLILGIDTSGKTAACALFENGGLLGQMSICTMKTQSQVILPAVKRLMEDCKKEFSELDYIAVSKGPGSYTGLRVGVSTAKGLCFGSGIPLLSLGTLDVLAWQAITEKLLPEGCRYIVPLVDARRMEVYTAVFQTDGTRKTETAPVIVDGGSFTDILSEGPVLFIGDAADKCRDVILGENAHFVQCCPKASSMAIPATKAFQDGLFEDTAYFEPFYLKDFIATKPKKNLF